MDGEEKRWDEGGLQTKMGIRTRLGRSLEQVEGTEKKEREGKREGETRDLSLPKRA